MPFKRDFQLGLFVDLLTGIVLDLLKYSLVVAKFRSRIEDSCEYVLLDTIDIFRLCILIFPETNFW